MLYVVYAISNGLYPTNGVGDGSYEVDPEVGLRANDRQNAIERVAK